MTFFKVNDLSKLLIKTKNDDAHRLGEVYSLSTIQIQTHVFKQHLNVQEL